jgi:cyclopropane-fatty-acyl-phospholipid synthase
MGKMPFLPEFSFADRWLLRRISEGIGGAPLRLVVGGVEVTPPGPSPIGTLRFRDRRTLAAVLLDPEIGFGEGYTEGRIAVEGDLLRMLEAVYRSMAKVPDSRYGRLVSRWLGWWQTNSLRGSRHNIHRHYDLGNDFYKLWLDPQLLYTCAYFPTPWATLEEAQIAKMDHVCRKLQLQPGETVVEAGCGWGALALHMARHYGVSVKAFNISREQIRFARERAAEEGLADRVEFIEDDYRNISGKFDVLVSVGMLEHVGKKHFSELGDLIHRSLGDSGRGFLHFIGRNRPTLLSRWIRKRIFPGGYPPSLREAIQILERWNYSVLDVENLRLHYAKTLEHWLDRFEKANRQVTTMYGTDFVRAWRLYLAGSVAGFETGTMQLFQIVFAGPDCRPMLWTRAPLYAGAPGAEAAAERKPQWTPVMS